MRILYLSPSEPYPGTHAGFTHVHNLLRNLTVRGMKVTLLSGRPETALTAPHIEGLEVRRIPSSGPVSRNLRALTAGLRIVKERKFDLIHERMETAGGAGTLLAKLTRLHYILEVNDPFLELNAPSPFHPVLRQTKMFQLSAADAVITQTPQIKSAIQSIIPGKRVFVIPNGADPDAFPLTEFPKNNRVGFMGSFMPWHGVHLLIDAFEKVLRGVRDAELILIGNPGRMRQNIEQEIKKRGLKGKVKLTGPVPSKNIPGLLSSCSVLAAPFAPELDPVRREYYRRFGFWWSPLKIFEYMASGRPIAASNMGMIPRYMKGAGLTFEPGDTEGLARAIISLLTDRKMAEGMGKTGRERVERIYNWRMVGHMTAMAYLNVVEGKEAK